MILDPSSSNAPEPSERVALGAVKLLWSGFNPERCDDSIGQVCPACEGFCGECRRYFDWAGLVWWWRGVPFHPDCGPPYLDRQPRFVRWTPTVNCRWLWCVQMRLRYQRYEAVRDAEYD